MNQPWINFDYSTTGLIFNGIGCLLWVVTYIVLLFEIRKKKFVEMPVYVAGANLGWEFVWSFFFHPNTGLIYALSYIAAFLLDCFIFYAILKYGGKQPISDESRKHLPLFCIINLFFWIIFCYTFRDEGYDTLNGANSGYIINVILSLQCLVMLFQTPSSETNNFSMLLGWAKMLGTGFITLSLFYFFPTNHFVQVLGLACLGLDNIYIYTLWRRHGKWL
ncbi:hypothetical protein Emtol_3265 [Emticicia oligotrophica DSM 17448]|jgi:hypothetical protein|uniref:PQ loop repeat protein n=1 Tax=Emticicia oligotrophica (strain DSM 17448 / CIP 109782 / MTCC 6937 / GPTSA100-15) TaxID=929562 RepID=A0ABM5N4E7_EMTOG|nr:hypothetical protein [Emticicia oligotrophica]AFK04394.1 hypothetical protein Emtol_3265 [Emticicia oligotrophica DSM 17448]